MIRLSDCLAMALAAFVLYAIALALHNFTVSEPKATKPQEQDDDEADEHQD